MGVELTEKKQKMAGWSRKGKAKNTSGVTKITSTAPAINPNIKNTSLNKIPTSPVIQKIATAPSAGWKPVTSNTAQAKPSWSTKSPAKAWQPPIVTKKPEPVSKIESKPKITEEKKN